jgi:hypothetical protein
VPVNTATSAEVPGYLPVAIAGHTYLIDPAGFQRETVPVLRTQADVSDLPSESSLNPKGLWLRSQESWHHGAGQRFLDGKQSGTAADPERFYASRGVNPWTRGQVSLAPVTVAVRLGANISQGIVAAGNHLYVADGTELYWSNNPTTTGATWTAAVINAGQAAQSILSLATNGYYVWAALGNSGLHRTIRGASTSTADVPSQACELVGFALDRLLIASAHRIWEVTDPLGTPALNLLYTHPDTGFSWKFISPGRNCIYIGGNAPGDLINLNLGVDQGANGTVYKVTLAPVDTALGPPSVATYLPDGEAIYNVCFYAGGIVMATSRGLRLGQADGAGNIDYGPLVPSAKPVIALEPQDRYVWYSSPNYGLARADLGWFTDTLTPAYAEDIQIDPADTDVGLAHYAASLVSAPGPVFAWYAGLSSGANPTGVYRPTTTLVASGTFETGQIRFGTSVTKTLRRLEVRHLALPAGATVGVEVSRDGGAYVSVGTSSGTGSTGTSFDLGSVDCESAELRFTLNRATDPTLGPTLTRWTLKALPIPRREETFTLPIIMKVAVVAGTGGGVDSPLDVEAEVDFLKGLEQAGTVVKLQLGDDTFDVFIDASQFKGENWSTSRETMEGTYTVLAQTVGS